MCGVGIATTPPTLEELPANMLAMALGLVAVVRVACIATRCKRLQIRPSRHFTSLKASDEPLELVERLDDFLGQLN